MNLPPTLDWIMAVALLVGVVALVGLALLPLERTARALPTQARARSATRRCCCPCHTHPRSAQPPRAGAARDRIARTAARRPPSTRQPSGVDLVKKL